MLYTASFAVSSGNTSVTVGGGGAGGSVLVVCATATLNTTKITAAAGSGGVGGEVNGSNGGAGIIAVHHSGTVTGTTSPTFTDTTDTSLVEVASSGFFAFL